jgi:hypothetical protein
MTTLRHSPTHLLYIPISRIKCNIRCFNVVRYFLYCWISGPHTSFNSEMEVENGINPPLSDPKVQLLLPKDGSRDNSQNVAFSSLELKE